MVARVAGFDSRARDVTIVVVAVIVVMRVAGVVRVVRVVRVVMIVRGSDRSAVMMLVAVRRRSVLMLGVLVPAVRMHVRRRCRGRTDGHDHREHERQGATHDHESTTTVRTTVKRAQAFTLRLSYIRL